MVNNDGKLEWCPRCERTLENGEVLCGGVCAYCLCEEGKENRAMNDFGLPWPKKEPPSEEN